MDPQKRKNLEEAGWVFGDAEDFLGLSEEESRMVDLRLAVSRAVRKVRLDRKLTQAQAAKILETSQAKVSNIEAAAGGVTLDLMFRSLFALGGTMRDFQGPPLFEVDPDASLKPETAAHPATPVRRKRSSQRSA